MPEEELGPAMALLSRVDEALHRLAMALEERRLNGVAQGLRACRELGVEDGKRDFQVDLSYLNINNVLYVIIYLNRAIT